MTRTVGAVTVARSDWGIYRPVLDRLRDDPRFTLRLYVSGAHLSQSFGLTVREIQQDGYTPDEVVEIPTGALEPLDVVRGMAAATAGFGERYAAFRPDVLLVLGDRWEMFAAAAAALPFAIPVAHVHGGESTEGAIDEAMRHAITKMSHLHFVALDHYRRRLVRMGEQPSRVVVTGAPALDDVASFRPLSREELRAVHGTDVDAGTLLVTFHPVTLQQARTGDHIDELLAALEASGRRVVFTAPGADTASVMVLGRIEAYVRTHRDAQLVTSLGRTGYFTAMAHAAAMVGNSSSGIIEAASFGLPVVDVGDRQRGRIRGANVVHAEPRRGDIAAAIVRATDPSFRRSLAGMVNPYGDGHAAERITETLATVELDEGLVMKRFWDGEA